MEVKLTSEEYAQILQTIEMFEVISQAEPGDCQSYDILKEAYLKIGQTEAALQVARKLAEAYLHMGLYSSALLECEGILQQQPDSPDIVALMGEIESRTHQRPAGPVPGMNGHNGHSHNGDRGVNSGFDLEDEVPGDRPSLTILNGSHGNVASHQLEESLAADDGNEHFARFLAAQHIVTEEEAQTALARVRQLNGRPAGGPALAASLLDEIAKIKGSDTDEILSELIDATKFGFIPLEHYDMDRAIVRLLPESLTLGRLMVPFDIVSRTVMIALCNPFDAPAKEAAQSQLDYHIQWYLARPAAISRVLRDAYRLDARD